MARWLTAARARVDEDRRETYLAAMAELAAAHRAAGGHFWLFEGGDGAGEFLEFAEHAGAAPADAVPPELAARLSRLAAYDDGRHRAWREVPLVAHPGD